MKINPLAAWRHFITAGFAPYYKHERYPMHVSHTSDPFERQALKTEARERLTARDQAVIARQQEGYEKYARGETAAQTRKRSTSAEIKRLYEEISKHDG